jgi:hypothetical protein
MESHGLPGAVQVTERTYELLRPRYELCPRGTIDIKGIGPTSTYLLLGSAASQGEGLDAVDGTPVLDVKPHMSEFEARGSSISLVGRPSSMACNW